MILMAETRTIYFPVDMCYTALIFFVLSRLQLVSFIQHFFNILTSDLHFFKMH